MATTALFVEVLIVGLQVMAWLVGLVIALGGRSPWTWTDVKDGVPILILALLAMAYVLGIVVDRASDSAYTALCRALQKAKLIAPRKPLPAKIGVMRLWIMKESGGISKFIDYQRSRVRIVRATVFNILAGTGVAALYVWHRPQVWVVPTVVAIGLTLAALTFLAAERINRGHEDRLSEAYLMLRTIVVEVVAAVCYRQTADGLEFLLVRTRSGKHWTFPRGHVKRKERHRPWKAAKREAAEESGAKGEVQRLPFAYYSYRHKGREDKKRAQYRAEAYLMKVTGKLGESKEKRDPTWFTPEETIARLTEGHRNKSFVKDQRHLVKAAVNALGLDRE